MRLNDCKRDYFIFSAAGLRILLQTEKKTGKMNTSRKQLNLQETTYFLVTEISGRHCFLLPGYQVLSLLHALHPEKVNTYECSKGCGASSVRC